MSRIKDLQKEVYHILEKNIDDADKRAKAVAHLHGVALAAAILAKKRGQNAELATMAGMLHDLWAYKSGSYDDHAHLGADYARKVLGELTTPEETEIICSAIYHHDDKHVADSPIDKALKDADVIHHCMNDLSKPVKDKERARFNSLCAEFGMEHI